MNNTIKNQTSEDHLKNLIALIDNWGLLSVEPDDKDEHKQWEILNNAKLHLKELDGQ